MGLLCFRQLFHILNLPTNSINCSLSLTHTHVDNIAVYLSNTSLNYVELELVYKGDKFFPHIHNEQFSNILIIESV